MKKSILILATAFLIGASLTSCKKEKAIEPIAVEKVTAAPTHTMDVLSVQVFFTNNTDFTASDYTLTVVDADLNVVVDSVVVSGVVVGNPYVGNTIHLPRVLTADGTIQEKVYNIFLGGRQGTKLYNGIPVVSGNVKDANSVYNTATAGYTGRRYGYGFGNIIVNDSLTSPLGVLRNQPHPESGFSETDPLGTFLVF